jgi:hypothetical protein
MRNNVRISSASGPTVQAGRSVAGVADFNRDTHCDYLVFNPATLRNSNLVYVWSDPHREQKWTNNSGRL